MEGIFSEFENENALRVYPFAAGCSLPEDEEAILPAGVFVDAALYPINPSGTVYLSSISSEGVFSVSDADGVIMTGIPSDNTVEFHDVSDFTRHVGTLVASSEEALAEFAGRGVERAYGAENLAFAASCVFPIVTDGVQSLAVGDAGAVTGAVQFANGSSDAIRVSSAARADGRKTLRFDVLPRPGVPENDSIRRIICVVDGQTPFRIEKLAYNTILLRLENVDKGVVCSAAHREDQYEMADTCSCEKQDPPTHDELPEAFQLEEVFIPPDEGAGRPEGGLPDGADNAFYLVVPNVIGYDNPLSITLEDGLTVPRTEDLKTVAQGTVAELAEGEMLDEVASKGVVIQVPGLSGGEA